MVIEEYYDNYLSTGKTRCNKMYYYIVKTDDNPNIKEMSLSGIERETDFKLFYVSVKDMEQFIKESMEKRQIENIIGEEMLSVMEEYEKFRR